MIVIKETVISFIKHINEKSRQCLLTAVAVTTAFVILICLLFSGTTISYNVVYGGKVVAQVADTSVYNTAFDLATESVVSSDSEELLSQAKIKPVISLGSDLTSPPELANIILENSDNVQKGYILEVDGKNELYLASNSDVNAALNTRLGMYNIADKSCTSNFANKVLVSSGYFKAELLNTSDEMSAYINSLDVVTVVTDTETIKIPFDTTVKKTSSKSAGYSSVTTKGVEGVKQLSKQATYLNGKVTEEKVVSEDVVKSPVNEVVVVGTASASKGSANKYLSSGKLVYPVDKNARTKITSYWGDGRNHKAIDIAGPVGTKIFASLSGTVVESRYAKDYGYFVLIDHGNGVKTRYAHCSKLYAKVGDKVTAGQTIALMGSTGQSTGPHLHFEVILNGTRVNPAPYLGIN